MTGPPQTVPAGGQRIAIAADHNGVAMKSEIAGWLQARGHHVDDRGTHGADVVDYPLLCADVCRQVTRGEARFGIVIGGSGQGEQIACNKVRGVRAALCHSLFTTEIARSHNDANVMVIGAKVVTTTIARELVGTWLATGFEGGRHAKRLEQIAALERGEDL
ncbi:MAG: ribose 5-phosphate isomerase B [Acidimicrobiales bacterium]